MNKATEFTYKIELYKPVETTPAHVLANLNIDWRHYDLQDTMGVLHQFTDYWSGISHVNEVASEPLDNFESINIRDFAGDWTDVDNTWESRLDECFAVLKFIARHPGYRIMVREVQP